MKKILKVIIVTVISFVIFEFVAFHTYSAIKRYERTLAQNRELREELRECQEKLEEYENPGKRVDKIQFAIKVR